MPLVDPQILGQRQSPDLMGAYQQGLQTRGLLRRDNAEQQKVQRMKAFEQAFDQASRGLDLTNAENMGNVLKQTFQMFPEETMETAKKYAEAFPQADQAKDQWDNLSGAESPTLYNKRTGDIKTTGVAGKPEKPAAPKKYQMVKNRKGVFEAIDPETGLNRQGKPVEAWVDPVKPASDAIKPTQVFNQEQQLRTQFMNKTKDFRDTRDAYGRIQAAAKAPSAAGDLALIFNYMKMLDPGSTVRESEFAAAAASGSLGDRFVAAGKKLLSGERLDPSQRADFVSRAKQLYNQQLRQYDKAKFETKKMAAQYPGLSPDRILMDEGIAEEPSGIPTFEQYDSLPSGAEFTDPDGNVRRKP